MGEEDGDDEGAATGCWMLVTGYRFQVSGVRCQVLGHWSLVSGFCSQNDRNCVFLAALITYCKMETKEDKAQG